MRTEAARCVVIRLRREPTPFEGARPQPRIERFAAGR
jgi:hypothetical protein